MQHFVSFFIVFVQSTVLPISFWNYDVFVAYFHFWILRYNIVPNLDHMELFNYVPNGYGFLNINDFCYREPLCVVCKHMDLICSLPLFSIPYTIFLQESLKPSISLHNLQKVSVRMMDVGLREYVHKVLNSLSLVNYTPQNYK